MSGPHPLAADATVRLEQLCTAKGVPRKVRRSAETLIERLRAPVRIGIVGLPDAGQLDVLAQLTDGAFAGSPDLPTLELAHGTEARCEAMLPDGTLVAQKGLPNSGMLDQGAMFLRLWLPEPQLRGRRLLLVVAPAPDLPAALGWAAERVDICLWCSPGWSATEDTIWRSAPERLGHRAVLVTDNAGSAEGFEAVKPAHDLPLLAAYLDEIVAEAAAQDMLAAEMILQRHAMTAGGPQAPVAPIAVAPSSVEIAPEARAELERLFHSLRCEAEEMRAELAEQGDMSIPEAVGTLLGSLSDRAEGLDRLAETWPEVPDLLMEAQDLALLMQTEDGPSLATDATRLLVQVRREMEVLLAA